MLFSAQAFPAPAAPVEEPGIETRDLTSRRQQSIDGLVQALGDRDEQVRERAAEDLGRITPAAVEAVDPLIKALKDKAPIVRNRAAEALQKIGTPKARKAVMKYRKRLPRHNSW